MMQLAELNGTFKPLDVLRLVVGAVAILIPLIVTRCRNCGSSAHKTWECPEQQNITSNIICARCGGGGHIASDCKVDL